MTKIQNSKHWKIEIWDLYGIWCLKIGILYFVVMDCDFFLEKEEHKSNLNLVN